MVAIGSLTGLSCFCFFLYTRLAMGESSSLVSDSDSWWGLSLSRINFLLGIDLKAGGVETLGFGFDFGKGLTSSALIVLDRAFILGDEFATLLLVKRSKNN